MLTNSVASWLMVQAASEGADNTGHLVRTVHELMQQAASMGMEMNQLLQSHSKLEDKSNHDPLTGLLNREGFINKAKDLLPRVARYGISLGMVYLDIDGFKSINDRLGHEFGDRALKNAADRMAEATRQQDLLGRMGGDEFALLLYDCKEPEAEQIVRRILSHVAAEPVCKGKQSTKLALSAGLLYVRPSNRVRSLDTLLSAADHLMYEAKQAGGNQMQRRIV
jgi:diguanylate cyclase (GGDEF)-like protein